MGNHCSYNGEQIKDLINAFLGNILGQMSVNYTQTEENKNSLGGRFSNLSLIFMFLW